MINQKVEKKIHKNNYPKKIQSIYTLKRADQYGDILIKDKFKHKTIFMYKI